MAEATASGTMHELRLPAQPSGLPAAREYAQKAGAAFGLNADDCYDFVYAVNEAVTNAIRHGAPDAQGQIHLSILTYDDRLTLAVRDYGTFVAPTNDRATMHEHGRGLALMAGLTDEIQICIEPGSTTVRLSKARTGVPRPPERGD
jgi:anti-sigma regulatory factor (Ser/Thr protein kinase)